MSSRPAFRVSVIITVKNDAPGLEMLIQDLVKQTRLPDEIVLSIADSSDTTLHVAQLAQKLHPKMIVIVPAGSANRAVGRNLGFAAATGDVFVSTDVGCRTEDTWLEHLVAPWMEQSSTELVGGLTLGAPESLWEAAQIPFVLAPLPQPGTIPLPATRNLALSRSACKRIGPFQSKLNTAEDYEWSRRAAKLGIAIWYQPAAVVRWRPRSTWTAYWRMIFTLTQGDMLAHTWRWGHLSMVARYVFLVLLALQYPILSVATWFLYGALKSWKMSRTFKTDALTTWGLQYLTDIAVLSGIVSGLWRSLIVSTTEVPEMDHT